MKKGTHPTRNQTAISKPQRDSSHTPEVAELACSSAKKGVIIFCVALLLSGGLLGCSSPGLKTKAVAEEHPPVILGQADFDLGGDDCHLSLIWVKGTHTLQDPTLWC